MRFSTTFKCFVSLFVTGSLIFLGSCADDPEEPVITKDEGVYINEIHAAGPDWVELYNSTDESKSIGDYSIYDDATKKYKLPATTIPAKGFLIIFCDDTGVGLNTNFKLSSTGETVYLENSSGELIDKVTFHEIGEGQSYGRYPDGSTTLKVSGSTTQGASNGETQAPVILQVTRVPLVPDLDDAVTVQAEFASTADVATAKLYYRLNSGTYTSANMTKAGNFFNGTIPAFNQVGKVEYYVEAKNTAGVVSVHPGNAPENTDDFLLNTDVLPALKINEFMAFNSSCCPDDDSGANEFDDWIEIYNSSDQPVNIGGMYLSDDKNNPFNSRLPLDNPGATTIPAKGFIIIWADGSREQGPLHLDFSLSNAGEDVALFYIDGRAIDSYTFGAQTENQSMGRSVDGAGSWINFASPTPGVSND
jgi:hypothetical protein